MTSGQVETGASEGPCFASRREKRRGFYKLLRHFSLGWLNGVVLRLSSLKQNTRNPMPGLSSFLLPLLPVGRILSVRFDSLKTIEILLTWIEGVEVREFTVLPEPSQSFTSYGL